jgi:dipeptidyl aminopeptidase/acylaminoacyl peptidase
MDAQHLGIQPEPQWFANRGYACLQVNYRASVGCGRAFTNAGIRRWGAAMHNDLVDAAQWAVSRGIAESKRVAKFGGSYGGYAALVAGHSRQKSFCCAVALSDQSISSR